MTSFLNVEGVRGQYRASQPGRVGARCIYPWSLIDGLCDTARNVPTLVAAAGLPDERHSFVCDTGHCMARNGLNWRDGKSKFAPQRKEGVDPCRDRDACGRR